MKNGVCRGAKPLCRESEGFFLARKKVRERVERFFSTLLDGSMLTGQSERE